MTAPKILFVDDDPDTRVVIGGILNQSGFETHFASNGSEALDLLEDHTFDLVILDYMMPGMDGVETCRQIRQDFNVLIILLSAKHQSQDILAGFRAGADDYIVKPIGIKEFLARINAILHRVYPQSHHPRSSHRINGLVLDADGKQAIVQERQVCLSPLEFHLLHYLMQRKGMVVSKEDLLYNVWGFCEKANGMNFVEAAVTRLRRKIEPDPANPQYILTVWGEGYRFGM